MNPSDKVKKTSADGEGNDGIINVKAARGQTIIQAYGKDASAVKGSAEGERGREMKHTGLKKSLHGAY